MQRLATRRLGRCALVVCCVGLVALIAACSDDTLPAVTDGGGGDTQVADGKVPSPDMLALDAPSKEDGAAVDQQVGDAPAGPVCGDGVLDPSETCDTKIPAGQPGACPSDCDDGNACTKDELQNDGTCQATCAHNFIVTCDLTTSDGCCPAACDATTDIDCGAAADCGNGKLDKGESCDTAINPPDFGACPTDCDDGNACTQDDLQGKDCNATCANTLILKCSALVKDGCCPKGCLPATDADCLISKTCGNGKLDPGETCDTAIKPPLAGSCPTSCDDGNSCTIDQFTGSACTLGCSNTPITGCSLKPDGCCPKGCTSLTDADCASGNSCGNGKLDKGETCDTAIKPPALGACPTSCDDGDACTKDGFTGSDCTLSCVNKTIFTCSLKSDGCCPKGCTDKTDVDCKPSTTCGNGVLDPGETCDIAIKPPAKGSCPTDCDDGNACTIDGFSGSGCTLSCTHKTIISCSLKSDGCCPKGCTDKTDVDCKPTNLCGNGVVDAGETCDIAIKPPMKGSCPTSCDDQNPCTLDGFSGSDCTLKCVHFGIKTCSGLKSDGCCPTFCTPLTDVDCIKK